MCFLFVGRDSIFMTVVRVVSEITFALAEKSESVIDNHVGSELCLGLIFKIRIICTRHSHLFEESVYRSERLFFNII